jgi:hypothetical protein
MPIPVAYPKGDVRRLLALAVAIADAERATITTLSTQTGRHKQAIQDDIAKLHELGIVVDKEKDGPVYTLVSWGPILKPGQLRKFLLGKIN